MSFLDNIFSNKADNAPKDRPNEVIKVDASLVEDGNFIKLEMHKESATEARNTLATYESRSSSSYYESQRRSRERSYKWKEVISANIGRMNFTDYDAMLYPTVPAFEAFARASRIDSTPSKTTTHKYELVSEDIPSDKVINAIIESVQNRLHSEEMIHKMVKESLTNELSVEDDDEVVIDPLMKEAIATIIKDVKGALLGYTKVRTKNIHNRLNRKIDKPVEEDVPHLCFLFASDPYSVEIHMEGNIAALFSLLLPAIEKIRSRYAQIKKYRNAPIEEIEFDYETKGKFEPMDHQKRMYKIHMLMDKSFDGSDMGVGKSYSALMVMDTRLKLGQVKKGRVLMIVPNNTIENWIQGEVATHAPHLKLKVIDGHYNERVQILLNRDQNDYDIYITNFETFSMNQNIKLTGKEIKLPLASIFSLVPWDMVLIDEAHRIKNHESIRAQNIIKHFDDVNYKMIMSGTINANKLWDVYFPFYFLNGGKHFNSVIADRANKVLHTPQRMTEEFKTAYFDRRDGSPLPFTVEEIRKRMEEFSVRFEKSECLDLPEKMYEQRLIDMDPKQKELYLALKNYLAADLGEKIDQGGSVTIFGIFAMMTKLAEAANGWIYDDNHRLINLPFNPKLDAMMDVLEDLNENDKCVIWSRFTNDLHLIYDKIKAKYGADSVAVMHGTDHCPICDARKDMRYTNQLNFNNLQHPLRFLISNQAVGSEGVNYTGATFEIFYSNSFVKTHRSQGENRCHRKGMRDNLTIIDLVMKDTVDVDVLMALKSWKSMSRMLLGHLGVNVDKLLSKADEKEKEEAPVIVEHIAQKPGECALTTIAMLTNRAIDYIRAWMTVQLGEGVKYTGAHKQIMLAVEHFLPEMKDQWEDYMNRWEAEEVSLGEKTIPESGTGVAIIRHQKSKRISHAIAFVNGLVYDPARRGKVNVEEYTKWMGTNRYNLEYVFKVQPGMSIKIDLDALSAQLEREKKEAA